MKKTFAVKTLALAGILAGSSMIVPYQSADAADLVELDFENIPIVFGLGVGVLPDYVGSDEYTFGIAPFARYTFEGQQRYIQLLANEVTFNVLDNEMFRLGPLVSYRFGRDDDVDDDQVSKMEEIDGTVELGAFGDVVWILDGDRRQRLIVGAKVYQDVGDESDGFRANFNVRYWHPVAKPVDINVSGGFTYQDDDYSDHYFGVNADNVGTSALPFYTADGGVNEYYGVVGANFYLNKNWLISVGVRGSVIAGDPGDSPIVDDRGDTGQWIAGVGVGYILW